MNPSSAAVERYVSVKLPRIRERRRIAGRSGAGGGDAQRTSTKEAEVVGCKRIAANANGKHCPAAASLKRTPGTAATAAGWRQSAAAGAGQSGDPSDGPDTAPSRRQHRRTRAETLGSAAAADKGPDAQAFSGNTSLREMSEAVRRTTIYESIANKSRGTNTPVPLWDKDETLNSLRVTDDADLHLENMPAKLMRRLEYVFKIAEERTGPIDYVTFCSVLRSVFSDKLPEKELRTMFMKIDTNCDGGMTWSEYVSFVLCELQKKDYMRLSRNDGFLPEDVTATSVGGHHHGLITRIVYSPPPAAIHRLGDNARELSARTLSKKYGRYIALSTEGCISFWSHKMTCLRTCRMETSRNAPLFASDMCSLDNVNCIAVSTSKSDIQFYETAAGRFERILTIMNLPEICVTLDYWYDVNDLDQAKLFWGDVRGDIYILHFYKCTQGGFFGICNSRRCHTLQAIIAGADVMRSRYQVNQLRGVHGDWVRCVRYVPSLDSVVSCCGASATALAVTCLGTLQPKHFYADRGVTCFDYSTGQNTLVTGGIEQTIQGWNPYINKEPLFRIKGLSAILHLMVNQERDICISITMDKNVSVYSLRDHTLVQLIPARTFPLIEASRPLTSAYFNNASQSLVVGSAELRIFVPDLIKEELMRTRTHDCSPVLVLYNALYELLVTACASSTVCVWDVHSGEKKLMFDRLHTTVSYNKETVVELTAIAFDKTLRRLITGGQNGTVKIWNFHNGDLLRELDTGDPLQVTAIVHIGHMIYVTGQNRRVTVFADSHDGGDKPIKVWAKKHVEDINGVAHVPPHSLATAGYDGDIVLWSLETNQPVLRLNAYENVLPLMDAEQTHERRMSQRTMIAQRFGALPAALRELLRQHAAKTKWMSSLTKRRNAIAVGGSEQPDDDDQGAANADGDYFRWLRKQPLAAHRRSSAQVAGRCSRCFGRLEVESPQREKESDDAGTDGDESQATSSSASSSTACRCGKSDAGCRRHTAAAGQRQGSTPSFTPDSSSTRIAEGPQKMIHSKSIETILYLETRKPDRQTATLLSCGLDGWVRAWSIHYRSGLLGQWFAGHHPEDSIPVMTTDKQNKYLVTGDSSGYVAIWDIVDYCVRKDRRRPNRADTERRWQRQYDLEERFPYLIRECVFERLERGLSVDGDASGNQPPSSSSPETTVRRPMLLSRVRCHLKAITSVVFVDGYDVIISASEDSNVRCWTLAGRCLGQLGVDRWRRLRGGGAEATGEGRVVVAPPPPPEEADKFVVPSDLKRSASPRSLRLLNGGVSSNWKVIKRGVVMLANPWLRLSVLKKVDDADDEPWEAAGASVASDAGVAVAPDAADSLAMPQAKKPVEVGASKYLGRAYRKSGRHHLEPPRPQIYEVNCSVQVWRSLPIQNLAPVGQASSYGPPASIVSKTERRRTIEVKMLRKWKPSDKTRSPQLSQSRRHGDDVDGQHTSERRAGGHQQPFVRGMPSSASAAARAPKEASSPATSASLVDEDLLLSMKLAELLGEGEPASTAATAEHSPTPQSAA